MAALHIREAKSEVRAHFDLYKKEVSTLLCDDVDKAVIACMEEAARLLSIGCSTLFCFQT